MWKVKVWSGHRGYIEYVAGNDVKQAIDNILATGVRLHEIMSVEAYFPERG